MARLEGAECGGLVVALVVPFVFVFPFAFVLPLVADVVDWEEG